MTIWTIILYTTIAAIVLTFLTSLIKKPKSWLVSFIQNFVGAFFLFSAAVKLIDPMGTAIKLEDYFNVFKMPFLKPFSHPISFFVLVLEFLLGVTLILGIYKKWTLRMLLALILFFTLLTGVSAIFNVVRDCGCFGDFVKLSPWTSFAKDIVLTAMGLFLWFNRDKIEPLIGKKGAVAAGTLGIMAPLAFALHNYYNLPVVDFRPYKIGANIPDGMEIIEPAQYENTYTYKNTNTGETKEFINTTPEGDEWEFVDSKSKVIDEGIPAPIHDFMLSDSDGNDVTEQLLSFDKPVLLFVLHDATKASSKNTDKIRTLVGHSQSDDSSFNYAFLSASSDADLEAYKKKNNLEGSNLSGDGTMLKTMIRSNPGVVLLKKGNILGKWHYRNMPTVDEINSLIL